jgi:hypothetical protein
MPCNIFYEVGVRIILVRSVRMFVHLSAALPVHSGLRQGDALSPLLYNFALEYVIRKI